MTPPRPRHHDPAPDARASAGADEPTTDCATAAARNPVDARIDELLGSVSRWSALFVGALTVVLAEEVAALLPLGDTATALALFPVSLALLYVLLTVAARLERR